MSAGPVVEAARPEWFFPPAGGLAADAGLRITDDGRVIGRLHASLTTTLVPGFDRRPEFASDRFTPHRSPTGGAGFHQHGITWENGVEVRVGLVSVGHWLTDDGRQDFAKLAAVHRDVGVSDPRHWPIVGRVHADAHGEVLAGSLRPGLTDDEITCLRLTCFSGEWAVMDGAWFEACGVTDPPPTLIDLVGVAVVERPGCLRPERSPTMEVTR